MTSNSPTSPSKPMRKHLKKISKAIMKSHRVQLPKYDLPVRLRPWFLVFTCVIMVILAFLGFTNYSRALPLNDKFLHFTCLCVATGVFYFIFDVEEEARRVWFWRHSGLIFTAVVCFFFGGFVSEIVQSLLPHKEFQSGDVVANWLGSTVGLYLAYYIERYYRSRREIARLYRPLETGDISDAEDEGTSGTQLLPLYSHPSAPSRSKPAKVARLHDVWDEREDLFGVGDDSDEEDGAGTPRPQRENSQHVPLAPPKILITSS
ncbi:uncharacterized protein F5147DRAFT_680734 [Suillus discolor]|uniref:VanZ-like domain-containing protein n=1 Tax=Suillus discolor TaxID=1912936 RepID=A0A9P7JXC4_9AGAM|nr:uncharacterized protein F5147DRAFT_680734 [Suillus discolor]KAG2113953.1 hypothetical protein F5147DRAFT_680734 [Suillus discolor]